jgi:hypothetical protein
MAFWVVYSYSGYREVPYMYGTLGSIAVFVIGPYPQPD